MAYNQRSRDRVGITTTARVQVLARRATNNATTPRSLGELHTIHRRPIYEGKGFPEFRGTASHDPPTEQLENRYVNNAESDVTPQMNS